MIDPTYLRVGWAEILWQWLQQGVFVGIRHAGRG